MSAEDSLTSSSSLESYPQHALPINTAMNATSSADFNSTTSSPPKLIEVHTLEILLWVLEKHVPFAIAVNKCVTPIWYAIGTIGNIMSAAIWLSPRLRSFNSPAYYLASLAIADEVFLLLHVFYELENPWLIGALNLSGWCETWNLLYMAAQYTCVLLVFAFTVERFLSICHPFRSERFSRTSRSPKVIVAIVMISVMFASPQAYFWHITSYSECQLRHSETAQGEKSFYYIWSWGSEMIVFGIVPILVLFANICVLRKMRHVGQLKIKDATTISTANMRYLSTTITLLWVSFFLIITTLPVTITFAIQNRITLGPNLPLQEMAENSTWQSYFSYYTARTIIKEIGMCHHVCNIFIYCLTSKRFRRRVMHILCGPLVCSKPAEREESWRNPSPLLKDTTKICLNSR
ncbi:probable G-protein coupled receptor 142 [Haliotis cracherodii]|uniref:probable G-protein coupled receptor 142 n=1 Tax=Haliotis cracherodii TaxID=6455 RepID=UPI0039EB540F